MGIAADVLTARWWRRALLLSATMLPLSTSACRAQQPDDEALQALIDELLPRLEVISGLEARQPVQFERRSRDQLRQFLERQLEAELPAEELRAIHGVYALLRLVPDTLDLRSLLLDLYTEQVLGYYDPETRSLYMVEGAAPETLRPVLAHELVHALQDQHTNLDSLVSRDRGNDRQLAAQAAMEGHATLAMLVLTLEEALGRQMALEELPDLSGQIQAGIEAQNEQFPVFRAAPPIIRETLLYPYTGGAGFVQALWQRSPAAAPIDSLLPQSSEQVSDPVGRFLDARDEPTTIVWAEATDGEWRAAYGNGLGQFEIGILLRERLGEQAASAAEGWDGDAYRLLTRGEQHALVWVTVWDDAAAADRFAAAYERIAADSPGRNITVDQRSVDGRAAVEVLDAPAGVRPRPTVPPYRLGTVTR